MVDYGGTFIEKILFLYFSDMNILGLKFSCKNIKLTINSKWPINTKLINTKYSKWLINTSIFE